MKHILTLLAILVLFFSSVELYSESLLPPIFKGKCELPGAGLFFYLNSSNPNEKFTLLQFVPDQSFIGHYDVQIICGLWLIDHDPSCEVICFNMWNASVTPEIKSTNESIHSTYTYSYSRPTTKDPDFTMCLELSSEVNITTPPVGGWFCMSVSDAGTTNRPPDFIMPAHLTHCPDYSISSSSSSTGTQAVSFPTIFEVLIVSSFLFIWRKKLKSKNKELFSSG